MPQSITRDAWQPKPYNQRNILQVNGDVSTWTDEDIKHQLEHNRILQKGFATRPSEEIIADMKLTKQVWLTDFICPKLEHVIRINIAARVATLYQVPPEDFDKITEQIYQTLDTAFHQDTQRQIDAKMAPLRARTEQDWLHFYQYQKNKDGTPKFGDQLDLVKNPEKGKTLLQALIRTGLDQTQRQISDNILNAKLKTHCSQLEKAQNPIIKLKALLDNPTNYMVLGAAGSGKSSILKTKKLDENQAIIISTDNYRAIQFSHIDNHLSDKQVFLKTQDTAYMIKERVADIFINEVMTNQKRPTIILDVVSIEPWMKSTIVNPKTEVMLSCLGSSKEIAPRAWKRAENPNSSAADKNRHVNTTALIKGHSSGSDILVVTPRHTNIILYNTNTRDRIPIKIATLDTINNKMVIDDLNQMAQFLGKKNLNIDATSEADLFTGTQFKTDRFQYTSRHQASCIISLLKSNPNPKAHAPLKSLSLQKNGQEYAKIEKDAAGQIKFVVSDLAQLKSALNNKKDKQVILELLVQTSIYNDKRNYLGNAVVYKKVMEHVMNPDKVHVLTSPKPEENIEEPTMGMKK